MSRKKQKNRQESAEERTFMGDLAGGLTAAVVALPLALAFGMASGLGASAGLYGAIITGLIAAIAGGTPVQITGPTGPITMLLAGVVATHGEGGVSFALLAMFLAGSFQILFGLLGLGKVIRFVPSSVVSGFMTGIGLLLIQQQYEPLLDPGEGHAVSITLGVGMITALLVYIAPRIHRSIPGSLAALVLVTTGTEIGRAHV